MADPKGPFANGVAGYVGNTSIEASEIPGLIWNVSSFLGACGKAQTTAASVSRARKLSASQILGSVTEDAVFSFEDGKPYVSMKRHLAQHGLTPAAYREKWGLPGNYPMVAPSLMAIRSKLAMQDEGQAKVAAGSSNAKLKVSFFGPFFFGDYWVLDHDPDYAWSIVGEPSGRYLWLLSRTAEPSAATREFIETRVRELGYDTSLIRRTQH